MRAFLRNFRLNLGLKRIFIEHPAPSSLFALLKPRRLRLPVVTLTEFLGAPPPAILYRHYAPPPLNTGPDDLVPVCSLAAAVRARRILEVGCHLGCGALNLALACPTARVVTYDIRPDAGELITAAESSLRGRIERRIVDFPTDHARLRSEPRFDFIYIDGDHTAAGVQADTDLAMELLAPGGIIAWHDYCHQGKDWVYGANMVPEVLNALGTSLPLRHLAGSWVAAWHKPAA